MPAKKKKKWWMICKIQVSISGIPATLIYNENMSFYHQCERSFGERCLGDDLKGYFKCAFKSNGEFSVFERVNDREW